MEDLSHKPMASPNLGIVTDFDHKEPEYPAHCSCDSSLLFNQQLITQEEQDAPYKIGNESLLPNLAITTSVQRRKTVAYQSI